MKKRFPTGGVASPLPPPPDPPVGNNASGSGDRRLGLFHKVIELYGPSSNSGALCRGMLLVVFLNSSRWRSDIVRPKSGIIAH